MATQSTPLQLDTLKFNIVRHVTVPYWKIQDGMTVFIKFNTAFKPDTTTFSERVRKSKNNGTNTSPDSNKPMDVALVTNLQTGEEMRLIAHAVLKSQMDESYANDSYAGKFFRIIKTKPQGKRYFNFDIVEIELEPAKHADAKLAAQANAGAKK